jgi:signal transduction histidine kinase
MPIPEGLPSTEVSFDGIGNPVLSWSARQIMRAKDSIGGWSARPTGAARLLVGGLAAAAVLSIGFIDYWADYRVQFTVLYILPIGFATIYVARWYAITLALLSVAVITGGDILANAPSPGFAIRAWNDAIIFSLFLLVIFLLDALYKTLIGLESKVAERTQALRLEMDERHRLEREVLDLSERERQAFGHELHDVVCQDLTGITIASHLLVKKLEAREFTESRDAREVAGLVEHALDKARSLARGFFTSGFDVMSLAETLREIAQNVQERTGVRCVVFWQDNIAVAREEVIIHLFRIAQEAIQNAVRHGESSHVEVSLQLKDQAIQLAIEDDGKGMETADKSTRGLGLRIMAYRASLIGGELKIERPATGGTRITCRVPVEKAAKDPIHLH